MTGVEPYSGFRLVYPDSFNTTGGRVFVYLGRTSFRAAGLDLPDRGWYGGSPTSIDLKDGHCVSLVA